MKKIYKITFGVIICFIIITLIFGVSGIFIGDTFREGIKTGLLTDIILLGSIIITKIILWMVNLK